MRPPAGTADRKIAEVASRSHGVVTREELLDAGITRAEIKRRLRRGSLIREYRGVYRVGHWAPSTDACYMAAVRACRGGARLSGRAAGYLHGLVKGSPPQPQVTAATEKRIEGIRTRRERNLDPRDLSHVRGIPVTSVPRTIVDLAAELAPDELARACHEAGVRWGTTPADVRAVLARRPNGPGAAKLGPILSGDERVVLSRLEKRFLAVLRDNGLPLPETNRPASGRRVDCRWPQLGVTVELDSYRFHNSRHAWEQDRRRERQARARGDEFRRYTWGDVFEEPRLMIAELRALLSTHRAD